MPTPPRPTPPDTDARLLADALAVPVGTLRLLSRDALGAGGVAGFAVGDEGAVAYVDTSLLPVAEETGLVLPDTARVWMHPADPHLPALAAAAFGHAAALLLDRLGLVATGAPEIVGYRAGRRAVLRVPTADGAVWVKVVRPRRTARIVETHARLRRAGVPVPAVLGWSPEGLLVLAQAEGRAATEGGWDPEVLLEEVQRMRARIASVDLDHPARTSLAARMPWYAARLTRALPDDVALVADIVDAVDGRDPEGAATTIHGDLHLGQLFLDPGTGAVSGLIDVDTAGRGHPADDAAAFIAHAVASAALTARTRDARDVWALVGAAAARWAGDPAVRSLTAVHLSGHALSAAEIGDGARARELLRRAHGLLGEDKDALTMPLESA